MCLSVRSVRKKNLYLSFSPPLLLRRYRRHPGEGDEKVPRGVFLLFVAVIDIDKKVLSAPDKTRPKRERERVLKYVPTYSKKAAGRAVFSSTTYGLNRVPTIDLFTFSSKKRIKNKSSISRQKKRREESLSLSLVSLENARYESARARKRARKGARRRRSLLSLSVLGFQFTNLRARVYLF